MSAETKSWLTSELRTIRNKALKWFVINGRDLPWRRSSDPYVIWVSEIMLQQTQVATVIPFFNRFLISFPNVVALANASLDDVYRHWAGLGYYRRARQLHQAANKIVIDHGGVFPVEFSKVLELPGIGRYTAGAILSFSSDQRYPIVEANTQRLFARLLHLKTPTTTQESQSQLWNFAELVLPRKSGSGHTNEALMEIGSQICLPKRPHCSLCPLQGHCPTFASGLQEWIPAPKQAKVFTDLAEAALVIRDERGRILMRRCGQEERWAGLWDFPRFDITGHSSPSIIRERLASLFRERFGRAVLIGNDLYQLKHAVTRYRITLYSFEAQLDGKRKSKWNSGIERVWADHQLISELALSSSGKRLWTWLKKYVPTS